MDAFGHKQLQGTATYLANFLAAECGCKTRAVELSTLQRSASHMASRVDIDEAFMVGGAAVKAADEGDTGKMVVSIVFPMIHIWQLLVFMMYTESQRRKTRS